MYKKKIILYFILLFFCKGISAQTLDYYLSAALKNSPLIKDLNNQILSSTFDSLLVRAAYKTQVSESTLLNYPFTGKNFGYDEAITNGGNYSSLVQVVKPLFGKRFIRAEEQTISLNSRSLKLNQRITEIDLKKSVTNQYLTAYSNFIQYKSNQSIIKTLREEEDVVKQLISKGIYLMTDYMNLSVSIKSQTIAVKQSFIQYKNDLNLLNFLCGIADSSTVELQYPEISLINHFDLNNSPVMVQFRIDSLKNLHSRTLIDLNYRPKINALADGGFAAVTLANIPRNFGASVGLSLVMPIYDGKRRNLEYKKIYLQEDSRIYDRNFYSSQYRQQWLQMEEELKLTNDLIETYKTQLSDQEKLIDLYKLEIQKGLVRFMDFVTIVTNYTATKNNYSLAEINRLQIINQMNYLK